VDVCPVLALVRYSLVRDSEGARGGLVLFYWLLGGWSAVHGSHDHYGALFCTVMPHINTTALVPFCRGLHHINTAQM